MPKKVKRDLSEWEKIYDGMTVEQRRGFFLEIVRVYAVAEENAARSGQKRAAQKLSKGNQGNQGNPDALTPMSV